MGRAITAAVFLAALCVGLLTGLFFATKAHAHDIWISQQGLRNAAGEWCCGAGDCFVVAPNRISIVQAGYRVVVGSNPASGMSISETIPFAEAQPSPDGAFWRCQRPDGTRRCFFAPPPGS